MDAPPPPHTFRPFVTPIEPAPSVPELLSAWRSQRGLVAFDSTADLREGGSWSLVAIEPLEGLPTPADHAAVRRLARSLRPALGAEPPGPFAGGFLGALAYDLGVEGEALELPADPWGLPPIVGGLYTDFALLDHRRDRAWLVLGEELPDGRAPAPRRRDELLAQLAVAPSAGGARGVGTLQRHVESERHVARIERARELIAAGEIYQANLAHRFTRRTRGHPVDLYLRLRRANPGAYSAYVSWGAGGASPEGALLSTSPELLLECDGRRALTRPIKGTIERGRDASEDQRLQRRLLASVKDRAELAMIVDLERNDLGRVAAPGSVAVEGFPTLESYATVHHLVADVSAELREGLDGGHALAALFPGGSITGAPKLAAMEAIAALEGEGRGFFSGSAGFLDHRGRALFNILIRTLVWRPCAAESGGEVSFHLGGGITWSSDPVLEEAETRAKGAALAASLAGPDELPDTLGLDPGRLRGVSDLKDRRQRTGKGPSPVFSMRYGPHGSNPKG